jgi:hypothetical protein
MPVTSPAEVMPTYFELEVERLGIANTPEAWPHSKPLRQFAKQQRRRRYIPEWLLLAWGLELSHRDTEAA